MTNREIDALVAEKIFGLKVINGYYFERRQSFPPSENGVTLAVMQYEDVPVKVKPYSTSIADAWAVVEKIIKDQEKINGNPSFCIFYDQMISGWVAKFYINKKLFLSEKDPMDSLKSSEMSICKAALRSVGVEI